MRPSHRDKEPACRAPRAARPLGWPLALLLATGCASQQATSTIRSTGESAGVTATAHALSLAAPAPTMLLDCQPAVLGTTVQFQRIPSVAELNDLANINALERVVLDLAAWPQSAADLQPLDQGPRDLPLVVVLPGYPPSQAQAEAWNQLRTRVRVIVVARGTPEDRFVAQYLNSMRGLERVVVWTDDPHGVRIERLAAPVSIQVQR